MWLDMHIYYGYLNKLVVSVLFPFLCLCLFLSVCGFVCVLAEIQRREKERERVRDGTTKRRDRERTMNTVTKKK